MAGSSGRVDVIADRVAESTARIGQLRERLRRLDRGEPSTVDDVLRARERAVTQAEHCVSARDRLVATHRSAAERHEQVAGILASLGLVERAEQQREAARRDVEAAGVAAAHAERESQVLDRVRETARSPVGGRPVPADARVRSHQLEEENGRLREALSSVFSWTGQRLPNQEERRTRLCRAVVARSRSPRWQGWAHSVCVVACSQLPSVRAAGITVQSGSVAPELMAASDAWAARMEELQQLVGDGPSITAGRRGVLVVADDVDAERERWPGYAGAVAGGGVRGVWAYPLLVHGVCIGSLALYHLRRQPIHGRASEDGEVLADIAGAAVLADLGGGGEDDSRDVDRYIVHVAVGLLASRLGTGTEDALARIRAFAFSSGQSLAEVADALVNGNLQLT